MLKKTLPKNIISMPHSIILAILLAILIFTIFIIDYNSIVRTDFISYFTGANLIFNGEGKSLYDIQTQSSFQAQFVGIHERVNPFKNFPTLTLILLPLTFFPIGFAYKIFVLVNILLLIIFINKFAKSTPKLNKDLIYLAFLLFFPTAISIITGQISIMLFILWFYLMKYGKKQNAIYSGILSGLLLIKPQYLIITPFLFFILKEKKKFIVALASSVLIQIILSLLLVGWEGLQKYPGFIINTESAFYRSDIYSQMSISSFLHYINSILGFSKMTVYSVNAILYLVFLFIFAAHAQNTPFKNSFSSASLFTLALTPHAWEFDLVLILLPIIFLLDLILKKGRKKIGRRLAAAILLSLFFSWMPRFIFYPFATSFILLASGAVLLVNPKLKLK